MLTTILHANSVDKMKITGNDVKTFNLTHFNNQ
jgi:hypothetical protein